MKKTSKQKADDEAQSKRFIQAAKKAQADETKEGADRAFKRIAAKPTCSAVGRKSRA